MFSRSGRPRAIVRRAIVLALTLSYMLAMVVSAGLRGAAATSTKPSVVYSVDVPKSGEHLKLYSDGVEQIFSKDYRHVEYRQYLASSKYLVGDPSASWLPNKAKMISDLIDDEKMPFAPHRVVVVFRPGINSTQDVVQVRKSELLHLRSTNAVAGAVPAYTTDLATNLLLAKLGVSTSERLFRRFSRSALGVMRSSTQARIGHTLLPFENAYLLQITNASVRHAVASLNHAPSVLYASPDWYVKPMHSSSIPIPVNAMAVRGAGRSAFVRAVRRNTMGQAAVQLPSNFALAASAQSLLNAPSVDAAAAYDEIEGTFHQLPGQGEIITNVSLGDLDDVTSPAPCSFEVAVFGPTTTIIGGQRYIDWPSLPLIPAYTADPNGNLSGTASECGQDVSLAEVGLDFSVMAPLPHDQQRAGEQGSGYTDLLGIAPGAQYRLVVPAETQPTLSDEDAAFLGAAMQTPKPDVITASLAFGVDAYGFPGRFLEDDPITAAIISSIVNQRDIVFCLSANDGTRLYTNAAIGPSGGSAQTNVIASGESPTSLSDLAFSTAPSQDYDTGSIDVGGSTLDDIFSAPPQYTSGGSTEAQHAYPETRWTGFTNFSSGFGSRVDISAPSDNVVAMDRACFFCGKYDAVEVALNGGTSASAPEVAAAAAVALQVARLAGHPFRSALDVRKFLERTATPIPNVSQADVQVNVGPQLNMRNAVETLLRESGMPVRPSVARVAIEQRRNVGLLDAAFITGTDPTNIDLQGSAAGADGSDADEDAWITIAPDWEGMPAGTTYRLSVDTSAATSSAARVSSVQSLRRAGNNGLRLESTSGNVLATTPWARLLPAKILQAAGMTMASSRSRTVQLTYQAQTGSHVLTSVTFALTFGPADATTTVALAPRVPSVVTGSSIPVTYDLSNVRSVSNPTLVVSEPGRVDPASGVFFHPCYTTALTTPKGTVNIPVSALKGGGIYGIGIQYGTSYSDFAFTRVGPAISSRPQAPLLTFPIGATPAHSIEIPYAAAFRLAWDVSKVPGATGAELEVSDSGPNAVFNYNPFNNPNGTAPDADGVDSQSVYLHPLGGITGSVTLNSLSVGLAAGMIHDVRILPTRNGVVIGEGSDVSTIAMDGIIPADGATVGPGFGLDASGTDGFLTTFLAVNSVPLPEVFGGFQIASSLETFDQTTKSITQTVSSLNDGTNFYALGAYANDIGLFGRQYNDGSGKQVFGILSPLSSGSDSAWAPPSGQEVDSWAINYATDQAAFFGFNDTLGEQTVFSSNLQTNTFGTPVDVTGLKGVFHPFGVWTAFEENAQSNEAFLTAAGIGCGPPLIATVNFNTSSAQSFMGLGSGNFTFGRPILAVDSAANRIAVTTGCDNGISIYDLSSGTSNEFPYPGGGAVFATADEVHHLFLVTDIGSVPVQQNNDGKSAVFIFDENGNLVKSYANLNFWAVPLTPGQNDLQVNSNTRTMYTFGPLEQQLVPIEY